MEHPDPNAFPFLTREMLEFGNVAKLELVVRSNQTTQRTIFIRGLTRSGKINITHIGTSTTFFTETITQIDDIPIMLAVAPLALANTHGDLYVTVSLRIDGDLSVPLLAGYVTQMKGLSWPNTNLTDLVPGHGMTLALQITQPSAGAEMTFTVPSNRIIHIRSIGFRLVTDANVADRTVTIETVHDGAASLFLPAQNLQEASKTKDYTFMSLVPTGEDANLNLIWGRMPPDLWLVGNDTLETKTTTLQAGDQFSLAALNVEMFFEGA